jgi:hypothetical protein
MRQRSCLNSSTQICTLAGAYILFRNIENHSFQFFEPHFNVVLVGENNFEMEFGIDNKIVEGSLLADFGWREIDKLNRIIDINEYSEGKENLIKEKFYIPVYSKWHKAENCILCFPEVYLNERCLIETGASSITPRLVFGLPKTKPNFSNNKQLDFIGSLLYGNLQKGKNKYLYFTRVGEIINKVKNKKAENLDLLKDWLKENIKKKFQTIINENRKVVLVTPSTSPKSNFVDLVNEVVFNYSANCLTISIGEDYIENSGSLYSDGLYKAEIVIYVDDVLSTINSFIETNNIINYIRGKINNGVGIDYCITLINRMTFESEDNLLLKLAKMDGHVKSNLLEAQEKLLYYCKFNNPAIYEPNKKFPLETESIRYNLLSKISSLDSTRTIFYRKHRKLAEHNIINKRTNDFTKKLIDDEITYGNKKLFQLLVLDKVFTLFEFQNNKYCNDKLDYFFKVDHNDPLKSFDLLYKEVHEEFYENGVELKIKEKHRVHKIVLERYHHNLNFVILKIICSTPLIYYKQIREASFAWVLKYLEFILAGNPEMNIIGINNLNEKNLLKYFEVSWNNSYSEYQKFKFLLKRSVQLKSNFIIHKSFFKSIEALITLIYENYPNICSAKKESENKFKVLIIALVSRLN